MRKNINYLKLFHRKIIELTTIIKRLKFVASKV